MKFIRLFIRRSQQIFQLIWSGYLVCWRRVAQNLTRGGAPSLVYNEGAARARAHMAINAINVDWGNIDYWGAPSNYQERFIFRPSHPSNTPYGSVSLAPHAIEVMFDDYKKRPSNIFHGHFGQHSLAEAVYSQTNDSLRAILLVVWIILRSKFGILLFSFELDNLIKFIFSDFYNKIVL